MNKKPTNWIQGMSVAQRKKQGITTVQPFYQPSKSKKETVKKVHYNVGQVDVEVNHSHQNKLRILKMTMENWSHDDEWFGNLSIADFEVVEVWFNDNEFDIRAMLTDELIFDNPKDEHDFNEAMNGHFK